MVANWPYKIITTYHNLNFKPPSLEVRFFIGFVSIFEIPFESSLKIQQVSKSYSGEHCFGSRPEVVSALNSLSASLCRHARRRTHATDRERNGYFCFGRIVITDLDDGVNCKRFCES